VSALDLHRDLVERIATELTAGRDHLRNRQRVAEERETHLRVGALRVHECAAAAEGDGGPHRAACQLEELPTIKRSRPSSLLVRARPRLVAARSAGRNQSITRCG